MSALRSLGYHTVVLWRSPTNTTHTHTHGHNTNEMIIICSIVYTSFSCPYIFRKSRHNQTLFLLFLVFVHENGEKYSRNESCWFIQCMAPKEKNDAQIAETNKMPIKIEVWEKRGRWGEKLGRKGLHRNLYASNSTEMFINFRLWST